MLRVGDDSILLSPRPLGGEGGRKAGRGGPAGPGILKGLTGFFFLVNFDL